MLYKEKKYLDINFGLGSLTCLALEAGECVELILL
jgi:hypothetical protein